MKKDKEITKVIFKTFRNGEVIALFPEMNADNNKANCGSYLHVGQHGAASYDIARAERAATPDEYLPLYAELTQIGYNLKMQKRISKKWFD